MNTSRHIWRSGAPNLGTSAGRRFYTAGWIALFWLLLSTAMLVDLNLAQPRLEAGSVSPVSIRAAERITFQSATRTEHEREKAANAIEPIYFPPDRSQALKQTSTVVAVANFLDAVRSDPFADEEAKLEQIAAIEPVQFDAAAAGLILALPEEEWREVVDETQRMVDLQMRGEIRENRLPALLRNLPNQISISLNNEQAGVVSQWAGALIVPNTFSDDERTEQARATARESIPPQEVTYEAGQIIVREGEIVSPEQVEALDALGLQRPIRSIQSLLGAALFLLLLVAALAFYLTRIQPKLWHNPRVLGMLAGLLVCLTLGVRILMPEHRLLSYLFPTSAMAMLVCVLLGADVAILATMLLSLIVGFVTHSVEMISYTFLAGTIAALMLRNVDRLSTFVWTGALVGLTNVGVVLGFAAQDGMRAWVDTVALSGMGLLNGVASTSMALVGFYVLSNFLGITTFLQLMELARPTHPLFRKLLLEAPGTYHHTIVVSNLAERAAEAIGADMLLVRVGAYYHDVGKLVKPHYYVENQSDGVNHHDSLDDPYESARIIHSHVTEGVRLAQQYKLPHHIIDFITQHHGTTLVAWFHRKACTVEGEEKVDATHFRYPGPKPQTRETAILLLADAVEAAARATKPSGVEEIDAIIRKIIVGKLGDGQLDECALNLRDLDQIRQAFIDVLQGIYHPRLAYPEEKKLPAPTGEELQAAITTPDVEEVKVDYERVEHHPVPDRSAMGTTG